MREKIVKTFMKMVEDPAKMLIWTGAAGWLLSSAAQVGAVVFNKKIKDEQKSFLIPQEMFDAFVNIGTFLLITTSVKKLTQKLFTTGKIVPKSLREWLNNNKELKDKVGKVDFNLDKIGLDNNLKKNYEIYKNFGTTTATIGAGIVASNIITPVIRNKMASNTQKNYRILTQDADVPRPNIQAVPRHTFNANYSNGMKI